MFGFVGCTAIATVRPLTAVETPTVWPLGIGKGPMGFQVPPIEANAAGADGDCGPVKPGPAPAVPVDKPVLLSKRFCCSSSCLIA